LVVEQASACNDNPGHSSAQTDTRARDGALPAWNKCGYTLAAAAREAHLHGPTVSTVLKSMR